MVTLFYVLFFLTILHFIYEGIILPSLRLKIRFNLFALRDKLRKLKSTYGKDLSDEVFLDLQESINNTIRFLPRISIELIFEATKELKENPKLIQEAEKKIKLIESCGVQEAINIQKESFDLFKLCIGFNTLALFIYLIPLAVTLTLLKGSINIVNKIQFIPESEAEKIIESAGLSTV
ncbi:MAG: hypothetical protein AB1728_14790 [Bacteroidota bacterium]